MFFDNFISKINISTQIPFPFIYGNNIIKVDYKFSNILFLNAFYTQALKNALIKEWHMMWERRGILILVLLAGVTIQVRYSDAQYILTE